MSGKKLTCTMKALIRWMLRTRPVHLKPFIDTAGGTKARQEEHVKQSDWSTKRHCGCGARFSDTGFRKEDVMNYIRPSFTPSPSPAGQPQEQNTTEHRRKLFIPFLHSYLYFNLHIKQNNFSHEMNQILWFWFWYYNLLRMGSGCLFFCLWRHLLVSSSHVICVFIMSFVVKGVRTDLSPTKDNTSVFSCCDCVKCEG